MAMVNSNNKQQLQMHEHNVFSRMHQNNQNGPKTKEEEKVPNTFMIVFMMFAISKKHIPMISKVGVRIVETMN